ncbi:MAG: DUF2442 domain-containing protein, partial [Kiritimatiellae bacterium]|nr:DUF2442 domain-containing protein [Kiritimatiellia bacterium]
RLRFEDDTWRLADLEQHLDGEIFYPLKNIVQFKTAAPNRDMDTVVWDNGADMSPDFLYKISTPLNHEPIRKVAATISSLTTTP